MTRGRGAGAPVVSLWVERTDRVTRLGAFVHRHGVLDAYADDGLAWARVCGYGIVLVNMLFSRAEGREEREDAMGLGPFHFRVLTPASRAPRIDASAARRLRALGRRHAEEASAYHGGRAITDLSVEDLSAWCAAVARGDELNEL